MFKRARLIHKSSPSFSNVRKVPVRFWGAIAIALFCFLSITSSLCRAQEHDVLCSDGSGSFQAVSNTAVTIQVRAARNGELATRTCEATLGWNKQRLIIATGVSQLDVDA